MKTVFHLNSGRSSKQSELLANIQNLKQDQTVEINEIQVVINSDAVKMVEKDSEFSDLIQKISGSKVIFNACSNSLENRGIKEENLLNPVNIVESGVGKINKLQDIKDFNYIKV